jgi:hypothetical protein
MAIKHKFQDQKYKVHINKHFCDHNFSLSSHFQWHLGNFTFKYLEYLLDT